MSSRRKKYTKEFKLQAVELADVRGSTKEIAEDLGIGAHLIYRWRRELQEGEHTAFSGNGNKRMSEQEKELTRLKKELADVRMERDILKKAVRIFSSSDRRSISS